MDDPVITVTRKGTNFRVVDSPLTADWNFWRQWWAEGNWEAPVLDAIDRLLPDGGRLIDIGAWVGPITLWAARRARVLAIEPDPAAFAMLKQNVQLNDLRGNVMTVEAAAVAASGVENINLYSVAPEWGHSKSSTTHEHGEKRIVEAFDVRAGLHHADLVKIDIEGGEALLLPGLGPELRVRRIPMILSLHPDWFGGSGGAIWAELEYWTREQIDDLTYICNPKASA